MQAARDVLSLLRPLCLVSVHARSHAYFYLQPSTSGCAEPTITVYLLEGQLAKGPCPRAFRCSRYVSFDSRRRRLRRTHPAAASCV